MQLLDVAVGILTAARSRRGAGADNPQMQATSLPTPRLRAATAAAFGLAAFAAAGDARAQLLQMPDGGAVTLVMTRAPEYLGARTQGHSVKPGLFLRWGRVTVSSGGGFAASRRQGESRGFGYDVRRGDHLDISLGLRFDGGRDEGDSAALAGMGDIKRTLRARISAEWRFAPDWKLLGGWTVDLFNRGGGNLGEATLRRDFHYGDRYSVGVGGTVTIGGDRYLQTYFGVTPEQSQRSGYPVYTPKFGLRDVSTFVSGRAEIGDDWVAIAGIGYTWLLGPAADSPLAQRDHYFGMSLGVGYRF